MVGKRVVLMMVLIAMTGFTAAANAGSLVCDVSNSDVAQVFTSDVLAALPVPRLHFNCVSTDPATPGTVQITTDLPVVSSPTSPPILTEGTTVYPGQVSGNVTTFSNIQIFQGTSSFDITNLYLDGTKGTSFTPIRLFGGVYTMNAAATYPAVTVGIFGQGGNGGTAVFGTDQNLYIPYATAFDNWFHGNFSYAKSATGGDYLLLNEYKLTSQSKWNNYASFSQDPKGRIWGTVPDIRSYIDNNSYAAVLRDDPLDQPFQGRYSFKVNDLWPNSPFSLQSARKTAAGVLLSVPDEAKAYATLTPINTFFGMTPVDGQTYRFTSKVGGYFDVSCGLSADGNTRCSSIFNNFLTPYVSMNGSLEGIAKSFNPAPQNWTINLRDFQVKAQYSDFTYNMSISGQDSDLSSTITQRDLLVNGFSKGTYIIQSNPIPYSFKKSDFHVRLLDDRSTNSIIYNALSGYTYNSCTGQLVSPATLTGFTFSSDYSKIFGGSLRLTSPINSDAIDTTINSNGSFSIDFNGVPTSTAIDQNELNAACLPPPSTGVPKLSVSPLTFSLDHQIGVTQCPTPIGDLIIANTGDAGSILFYSLTNTYSVGANWLNVSKTNGSVSAGGTDKVSLQFNCNVSGPNTYTATTVVTGTDSAGNVVGTDNVSITVNVHN